jgi:pre-mRNA-processing factor 40
MDETSRDDVCCRRKCSWSHRVYFKANCLQKALASTAWKEYNHDGRKYWHNTETNTTTWDMPDVLKNAQPSNQLQAPQSLPQPVKAAPYVILSFEFARHKLTGDSSFVASSNFQDNYQSRERDNYQPRERDNYGYQNNDRPSGYSSAMPSNDQEYSSHEEAEAVFHKLLRKAGVQPEWSWSETIKAVVKDPQYRAIKDAKDRKISFEKYVSEVRAQEKDREKDRQAKLRTDFYSMLKSHPEIRHYTRWKTAKSIIQGETIFRSAKSEDEAHTLFNEYRAELLKAHNELESKTRTSALDQLVYLLQSLDLEPYTRWSEAQATLQMNDRFQGDPTFKSLTKIDVLKAFENHIKSLERTFNDKRQQQKMSKARKERQNRDQFIALLKELRSAGKIMANTKWTDIHDLIEDDPRYVAILGQSGSTPWDLFWDMIEEEDRILRNKKNDALDVLEVSLFKLCWNND